MLSAELSRTRFQFGNNHPLTVRYERLNLSNVNLRILYASDLHLRPKNVQRICEEIVAAVSENEPDVICFGGDLIDSSEVLPALSDLIAECAALAPVGAVAGNHDAWFGVKSVRRAVLEGGGRWLDERPIFFGENSNVVAIIGPGFSRTTGDATQIVCAHDPAVFPNLKHPNVQLVLAGHLHGSQCVFFEKNQKLYPGAFFYRWNGLRFDDGRRTMLVSRGVTDTLPIRWNCPREVLVCDL